MIDDLRALRRPFVALLVAVVVWAAIGWLVASTPAGAIETASFGIAADDRVDREAGERVRLPVEPGTRSRLHLRVWNKTDAPLALTLQPAAARVDGDGSPELGGDPAPVAWVALDATEITLGPRRQRIVTMTVEPSGTVDGSHAVAILATPADQAANPAVLERLGVVVELHAGPVGAGGAADGPGSVAGVPLLVALLGLGCVAAVGIGAWRLRRHADALPLGPARL